MSEPASAQPEPVTLFPSSSGDGSAAGPPKSKVPRARPQRALPTERVAFAKQLDILRAFAAASGPQAKPVALAEVAKIMQMLSNTVSLTTPFFVEAGLLTKTDGSRFIPAAVVSEFARVSEWNKDIAPRKLASTLHDKWFVEELRKRLSVHSSLPLKDATEILGAEAGASREQHAAKIRMLLDFLEGTGVVERQGNTIRLAPSGGDKRLPGDAPATPSSPDADPEPRRAATFSGAMTVHPEGMIAFSVSIKVDVTELAGWSPDRIRAFFAGLAQVIAAKSGVEHGAVQMRP